jgi:hypothetical protein
MKYFHPELLSATLRKHREAQKFVQRACRGLICRVRYRKLLENKAAQTAYVDEVTSLFLFTTLNVLLPFSLELTLAITLLITPTITPALTLALALTSMLAITLLHAYS